MPSLFRFLTVLAVLAGLVYGAMFALVMLVEPRTREMSVRVPADRINPVRIEQPADNDPSEAIDATTDR